MSQTSRYELNEGDQIILVLLLLGGLFFLLHQLTPYYNSYWYYMVWFESRLASVYSFGDLARESIAVKAALSNYTPQSVPTEIKTVIERDYLPYLWHRWAFHPLALYLGYRIYKKRSAYSGMPNLKSLLETEHKLWPALEFVKRFNPHTQFEELKGIGRYQERPVIFAANNAIIKDYLRSMKKSKHERVFDWDKAKEVFIRQLGNPVTGFRELPSFAKLLVTLAVAKDLPKHFRIKTDRGDAPAYDELLRLFSIELSKTDASRSDMEEFLNEFTQPLMTLLDGAVWPLSLKKMFKYPDFAAVCSKRFKGGIRSVEDLHRMREFPNASFSEVASLSGPYPLMNSLVDAVVKQHMEKGFNFRESRTSTYFEFSLLITRHAFTNPLVVRAAFTAKRNGKFPPGRLTMFRPWDRDLFFAISSAPKYSNDLHLIDERLGFPGDASGTMSHFFHEIRCGRKVSDPFVRRAVDGLHATLVDQNVLGDN